MGNEKASHRWLLLPPLIVAAFFACFWMLWYFIHGEVPVTNAIKISDKLTLNFSHDFSRWGDVLLGPILAIPFAVIFRSTREDKDYTLKFCLGLFFGAIFGFVFSLGSHLGFGVVSSVAVSLILYWGYGLYLPAGVSLGFGLGVGLGIGLIFGLLLNLLLSLLMGMIANLVVILRYLFSKDSR